METKMILPAVCLWLCAGACSSPSAPVEMSPAEIPQALQGADPARQLQALELVKKHPAVFAQALAQVKSLVGAAPSAVQFKALQVLRHYHADVRGMEPALAVLLAKGQPPARLDAALLLLGSGDFSQEAEMVRALAAGLELKDASLRQAACAGISITGLALWCCACRRFAKEKSTYRCLWSIL